MNNTLYFLFLVAIAIVSSGNILTEFLQIKHENILKVKFFSIILIIINLFFKVLFYFYLLNAEKSLVFLFFNVIFLIIFYFKNKQIINYIFNNNFCYFLFETYIISKVFIINFIKENLFIANFFIAIIIWGFIYLLSCCVFPCNVIISPFFTNLLLFLNFFIIFPYITIIERLLNLLDVETINSLYIKKDDGSYFLEIKDLYLSIWFLLIPIKNSTFKNKRLMSGKASQFIKNKLLNQKNGDIILGGVIGGGAAGAATIYTGHLQNQVNNETNVINKESNSIARDRLNFDIKKYDLEVQLALNGGIIQNIPIQLNLTDTLTLSNLNLMKQKNIQINILRLNKENDISSLIKEDIIKYAQFLVDFNLDTPENTLKIKEFASKYREKVFLKEINPIYKSGDNFMDWITSFLF